MNYPKLEGVLTLESLDCYITAIGRKSKKDRYCPLNYFPTSIQIEPVELPWNYKFEYFRDETVIYYAKSNWKFSLTSQEVSKLFLENLNESDLNPDKYKWIRYSINNNNTNRENIEKYIEQIKAGNLTGEKEFISNKPRSIERVFNSVRHIVSSLVECEELKVILDDIETQVIEPITRDFHEKTDKKEKKEKIVQNFLLGIPNKNV